MSQTRSKRTIVNYRANIHKIASKRIVLIKPIVQTATILPGGELKTNQRLLEHVADASHAALGPCPVPLKALFANKRTRFSRPELSDPDYFCGAN